MLKLLKRWWLSLFFKVQHTQGDSQSKEVKAQATDTFTGVIKELAKQEVIEKEQWFPKANNLMDAHFDEDARWNNHSFVPHFEISFVTTPRVEGIGRFTDDVKPTKYEPHRDNKPTTVHYTGHSKIARTEEEIEEQIKMQHKVEFVPSWRSQEAIDHLNYLKEHPEHPDNRHNHDTHTHSHTEHTQTDHTDSTHHVSDNMGDHSTGGDD